MVLKGKFCAKCGKSSDKLSSNVCPECFLDIYDIKIPKSKELRLCSKCGCVLVSHFWINSEEKASKEVLADKIKNAIHCPEGVSVVKVELIKIKPDGEMEITFDLDGNIYSKKYTCNLKVQKQICPSCKKQLNPRHSAVLQLRTKEKFDEFIEQSLAFANKHRKFVIRIKEYRAGIDIFLRSKFTALQLAHKFKEKYNCHMKESREDYGWDRRRNKPKHKSTFLLTKR
jgi:NMD protein affecting ribosome stability and mRNA decay